MQTYPASTSVWRRLRPLWAGSLIGVALMVLFLTVGSPENWDFSDRTYVHVWEGHMMPIVGFFSGLMLFLWRKARATRC